MDARSVRAPIRRNTRLVVAALVATLTLLVGAAPAGALTSAQATAANPPSRTAAASPAQAVADDVEAATRSAVDIATYSYAVLDGQRRAEEAAQNLRVIAWIAAVQANERQQARNTVWDAIARCETGGNWQMQGSRFSGGVGFANSTWSAFGGGQFAPNAGMATREQQIIVAERVYDYGGYSGWGCAYTLGLVSR